MDVFEGDVTQFDPRNPYRGDEKTPVQFRIDAVKDDEASEKAARPIYKDTEFIRILLSKDEIVDRPVRDTDKQRWPGAYAAWKNTGVSDPGASGQRLEHWPQMTRAQCEELKHFKIYTVEQLSELNDAVAAQIMGAVKLKQLARLAVEAAKGEAPFIRMQGELDKRDGEVSELKSEVQRLTKMIEDKLKSVAA